MSDPYVRDLGLEHVKIKFKLVPWSDAHGSCYPVRNSHEKITGFVIEIFGGTASKPTTLRRTLAHECYHVYQRVNGLKVTEAAAKRYEKEIM